MRIGIGFDIHKLAAGRKMLLGGVEVPHEKGLEGHSDADVLLHAVTDALLGAVGEGDIGTYFPDTDPRWKGVASKLFVQKALELVETRGFKLTNVDFVIIAEQPKFSPHRPAIRESLARILRVTLDRVSVKAKTMEGLGPIGEGKAIACYAVVLLEGA